MCDREDVFDVLTNKLLKRYRYDVVEGEKAQFLANLFDKIWRRGNCRPETIHTRIRQWLDDLCPPNNAGSPGLGITPGFVCKYKAQLALVGLHTSTMAGICSADKVATAIVVNGGYADDVDYGAQFVYVGEGGEFSGRNQEMTRGNAALLRAWQYDQPIRVIRGYKAKSKYAPKWGFRYDGLHTIKDAFADTGVHSHRVWKFLIVSCEDPTSYTPQVSDRVLGDDSFEAAGGDGGGLSKINNKVKNHIVKQFKEHMRIQDEVQGIHEKKRCIPVEVGGLQVCVLKVPHCIMGGSRPGPVNFGTLIRFIMRMELATEETISAFQHWKVDTLAAYSMPADDPAKPAWAKMGFLPFVLRLEWLTHRKVFKDAAKPDRHSDADEPQTTAMTALKNVRLSTIEDPMASEIQLAQGDRDAVIPLVTGSGTAGSGASNNGGGRQRNRRLNKGAAQCFTVSQRDREYEGYTVDVAVSESFAQHFVHPFFPQAWSEMRNECVFTSIALKSPFVDSWHPTDDVAQGKENFPVPCENLVNDIPPPTDFTYCYTNILFSELPTLDLVFLCRGCVPAGTDVSSWRTVKRKGHSCTGVVDPVSGQVYCIGANHKEIQQQFICECSDLCPCKASECSNRRYRPGLQFRSVLQYKEFLGWDLRSDEVIPKNAMVVEYAGDLITAGEMRARVRRYELSGWVNYCFGILDDDDKAEGWKSPAVDSKWIGNIGRFINHSCDPNLDVCVLFQGNLGERALKTLLVSKRQIEKGESLSYDYGRFYHPENEPNQCCCGTAKCRGTIGGPQSPAAWLTPPRSRLSKSPKSDASVPSGLSDVFYSHSETSSAKSATGANLEETPSSDGAEADRIMSKLLEVPIQDVMDGKDRERKRRRSDPTNGDSPPIRRRVADGTEELFNWRSPPNSK